MNRTDYWQEEFDNVSGHHHHYNNVGSPFDEYHYDGTIGALENTPIVDGMNSNFSIREICPMFVPPAANVYRTPPVPCLRWLGYHILELLSLPICTSTISI